MAVRLPPPSRLDRVIAVFSPEAALRRYQARAKFEAAASWAGGDRRRRAISGWDRSAGASANADLLPALPDLRDNARDLSRNVPLARGALRTVRTNVVGGGLKPRPSIDREALGLGDEAADAWEREAERVWRAWAGSTDCDIARGLTFAQLQRLAYLSRLENGDLLAVRRYRPIVGKRLQLAVQLVEADRLCNPSGQADRVDFAGGVEFDANGVPVAYHVSDRYLLDVQGGGARTWTRLPAFGINTGRRVVWHLFEPERIGQSRGVPYLAPVTELLKQLGRYTDAEVFAAVATACFTITSKSPSGAPITPSSLVESGTEQAAGAGGLRQVDIRWEPGLVIEGLQPDESVEGFDPGRPNQAFDPFVQAILRQIGVGLELPFEVLIKHFTASYSAARAALLEAWKFFRVEREWLEQAFCRPWYEELITEAVGEGLLAAPGFFTDPATRAAYLGCEWDGPAPGQIDPVKEVEAAVKRMDARLSTLAEETSGLTGGDWEANLRQRARERAMAGALGEPGSPVAAVSAGPGAAPAAPPADDAGPADAPDLPDPA